ncbi:MAG TPA: DUF4136 domain-containing protein, partial [Bacteroidales bacterium]|nr:DUF4136 domain-containing protein [Bacteroidales bacterium]
KSDAELQHEQTILDKVAEQMDQLGFTRLTLADTSDQALMDNAVILLVSRSTTNYQNYYYDYWYYGYDYWNWYGGMNYYYPGYSYNYYYPWGYPVSYQYTVGTVILQMVDPSNPQSVDSQQASVDYPVRWMAVLNGIMSGSLAEINSRITKSISQAFDQSPYL